MATIYRRGPAWYLNWIDEDGKRQQKSLGKITETAAQARLAAVERRLTNAPPAAGPAFDAWAVRYAQWHSKEYPDSYFRVEQILRTHLIPALQSTPLMAIRREDVERYKHARIGAGAAPATVTKELRTLKACINHAVAWDAIPRNPIQHVKPPRELASKPPRWYIKEELEQIYRASLEIKKSTDPRKASLNREYRWTWQLLANTGLRRTEALHLDWKDIGREELRVVSRPTARTKSGKWRSIPISDGAKQALEELRYAKRRDILPHVRPESLSRSFERSARRADVDGSIHCLRHTYCSHLVMQGVPLRTVQVLAGHASFATTEKYAHLAPGHLQDAIRGLRL